MLQTLFTQRRFLRFVFLVGLFSLIPLYYPVTNHNATPFQEDRSQTAVVLAEMLQAANATSNFCEGFESGSLPAFMTTETTSNAGANGRVQLSAAFPHSGTYHVNLDTDCDGCGGNTQQALIVSVDLAGATQAGLNFWIANRGDESHVQDGVFISDDSGATYTRILDYSTFSSAYTEVNIDLAAAAATAGLTLVDGFLIKFQGYDNYTIGTDGYSIDDVCICTPPAPLTVTAVANGSNVDLLWNDTGSNSYEVWYSLNTNYITPGGDCSNPAPYQCQEVQANSFTGIGWAAHPDLNFDYFVLDVNGCGQQSPWSQSSEQGSFTFPLGSNIPANLALTSTAQPKIDITAAAAPLTYILNYANASRYTADNVVITEAVPDGTTFNAGASTAGWTQVGGTNEYTFALGTLAPWANGSVTFVVNVDSSLPRAVTNSASIAYTGVPESYVLDNSVTIHSALNALPDSDNDDAPDWAETNTGVFVGAANTGSDPNNPDTDGDSLLDGDESRGTVNGLDLPGLGTSPLRQDILLEHDWFDDSNDCGAHSHRPTATAVNEVTAVFAAAPIDNPDGSTGINMIHDYGQGGLFTGGNLIPDADGVLTLGVNSDEFVAIKNTNFNPNRHGYFHYVLMPHRYNTTSSSSGQAELPGDDLIVSLQCYLSNPNVAHTFMHELGHNLLLRHGGFENLNNKPNYNSVMNYNYQFPGVDNNCTPPGDGVLDYSYGTNITLDENNLNESDGICNGVDWDWNGNSVIENGIAFNLNPAYDFTLDIHQDYNDWANLSLSGLNDADGTFPFPEIITEEPLPDWITSQPPVIDTE